MSSKTIRVQKLQLQHFRGIRSLSLDFSGNTTVLVGVNGAGKTSILEALRIFLAQLIDGIRSALSGNTRGSAHSGAHPLKDFLQASDVQVGAREVFIGVNALAEGRGLRWVVEGQTRVPGELSLNEYTESLDSMSSAVVNQAADDPLIALPLAMYYAGGSLVVQDDTLIGELENPNQLAAYKGSMTGEGPSSTAFIKWFRQREDYENEGRLENSALRDAQLEAVRHCVEELLPGFSGLRIRRQPMRMVVRKGSTELEFRNLSEGERYLLTLGSDIVRRLSLANPKAENPRLCSAVILIDEIDTHLHPSWQRRIIPSLNRAFPNCQFIVATHSPQVLSNVPPECIYVLSQENGEVRVAHPEASFGRDSNRILEDLMGVDERPSEIKKKLSDYFLLIDQGRSEEARLLRQELESSIGSSDPEFTRADVLIHTRELLSR